MNTVRTTTALLQRVHAKDKLLGILILTAAICLITQPQNALYACGMAAALLLCSGLPFTYVLHRLALVNVFFLLLWLLLPLSFASTANTPVITFGPLAFTQQGFTLALLITLKGNALTGVLLALAGSSSLEENGHAMHALRVPRKLVVLLLLTHGNIHRMELEYQRLFAAARLRGFVPRTTIASYKTYAWLLGLLLVRAWQQAQRTEEAMRLRSFCGKIPLITQERATTPFSGKILLAVCSITAAVLVFWGRFPAAA